MGKIRQIDPQEAEELYTKAKGSLECECARLEALAAWAEDDDERRVYSGGMRLCRKALDGLAKKTPLEYAQRQREVKERLLETNEAIADMRRYLTERKRCRGAYETPPPHPRYQKQAWEQWKYEQYHVKPFITERW